jgi:hypothetical protein
VVRLGEALTARAGDHPLRVAIDAAAWTGVDVVPGLSAYLRVRGRPPVVVDSRDFLRPASLRLERGRDDPDAYYEDWLDRDGLRREVLDPLGPGGSRRILPTLWDANRDRATRAGYVDVSAHAVLLVSGWFLLGAGLPFDVTVHLALSTAARERRVPVADAARELPAWQRYDAEVMPSEVADLVVRCDDPRRPAVIDRLPAVDR